MPKFRITVLTVGIRSNSQCLKRLPLRVLIMDCEAEAVMQLFKDKIDVIISHWNLIDMPNGKFLKNIIAAKPNLPTIAFVKAGDKQQELVARHIGVSVVLADDIDDEYFCRILRHIFNLDDGSLIRGISNSFQNEVCCF